MRDTKAYSQRVYDLVAGTIDVAEAEEEGDDDAAEEDDAAEDEEEDAADDDGAINLDAMAGEEQLLHTMKMEL
jgi:hypothetical protein